MKVAAVRERLKCAFSPEQILLAPSGTISEPMAEIRAIRGHAGLGAPPGLEIEVNL